MAEIDEPIRVVPYDDDWPQLSLVEAGNLRKALRSRLLAIEHIGSTAVPDLAAKPVVDILVGVEELSVTHEEVDAMARLGYEYLGEAGVPGRLHFRKRGTGNFNVHLAKPGSDLWESDLLFRDYLRSHPQEAKRYAELKCKLAAEHPRSLLEYSRGKEELITDILKRATASRPRHPGAPERERQ